MGQKKMQHLHAEQATPGLAIAACGLTKRYGDHTAVDALDLAIRPGQFFGLLGPNGSGKTTTIHMLSSLIRPSSGTATVAGYDIGRQSAQVRGRIGIVFQDSALDRTLTVSENLRFAGLLHDLPKRVIQERSERLLALFGLAERKHQRVATLSGGMRRALDIARSVIHRPQVLFLDEPTTGLDLPARRTLWRYIGQLRREGMTVFLTTHYLEEAGGCDEVAFIRAGCLLQAGAPGQLISQLANYIIDIEGDSLPSLAPVLKPLLGNYFLDGNVASFLFKGEDLSLVAGLQGRSEFNIRALRWRRPSLNDVFLWVASATHQELAA